MEANQDNYVGSAIVADSRSMFVRFVPNPSENEKAPKFRALLELTGPIDGLCTEFPVYKARDGVSWEITMPGGKSFPSVKAMPKFVKADDTGIEWETKATEPAADRVKVALLGALKTAFGAYLVNPAVNRHEITIAA